jgi:hypothetical protein
MCPPNSMPVIRQPRKRATRTFLRSVLEGRADQFFRNRSFPPHSPLVILKFHDRGRESSGGFSGI